MFAFLTERILCYRKTNLTVCVGEKGKIKEQDSEANLKTDSAFNGGGRGMTGNKKLCAGSGVGGTDIRVGPNVEDRIIVAGGGGGDERLGEEDGVGGPEREGEKGLHVLDVL